MGTARVDILSLFQSCLNALYRRRWFWVLISPCTVLRWACWYFCSRLFGFEIPPGCFARASSAEFTWYTSADLSQSFDTGQCRSCRKDATCGGVNNSQRCSANTREVSNKYRGDKQQTPSYEKLASDFRTSLNSRCSTCYGKRIWRRTRTRRAT